MSNLFIYVTVNFSSAQPVFAVYGPQIRSGLLPVEQSFIVQYHSSISIHVSYRLSSLFSFLYCSFQLAFTFKFSKLTLLGTFSAHII